VGEKSDQTCSILRFVDALGRLRPSGGRLTTNLEKRVMKGFIDSLVFEEFTKPESSISERSQPKINKAKQERRSRKCSIYTVETKWYLQRFMKESIIVQVGLQQQVCGNDSCAAQPPCERVAGVWTPGHLLPQSSASVFSPGTSHGHSVWVGTTAGRVSCGLRGSKG
jgi:hypothetical protein